MISFVEEVLHYQEAKISCVITNLYMLLEQDIQEAKILVLLTENNLSFFLAFVEEVLHCE